jgi:flagellar operon protein
LISAGATSPRAARAAPDSPSSAFAEVLKSRLEVRSDVRFSAHALRRLEDRDIHLSDHDQGRIREAVDQLGAKGGRESLVLMDKLALVVSVPNRTVITAVPTDELDSSVFTQIDSALVVGNPAASA